MTNFTARLNNKVPPGRNKKDYWGVSPKRRRSEDCVEFVAANRWRQLYDHGLPSFSVGPEPRILDGKLTMCMVARCDQDDSIELVFPATTDYAVIHAKVFDKMLELIRDAPDPEAIDWDEWGSEGLVYDF